MVDQRPLYETAVIERLKESGFLEIEIRTECFTRCNDGYLDEVVNAGWHYWNAALAARSAQYTPAVAAFAAIDAERRRQTASEGWTPAHDDEHRDGSMAVAAACYAMFASVSDAARADTDMPAGLTVSRTPIKGWAAWLNIWPWSRQWWKPSTRKRELEKAGALIAAEWERLDRLEKSARNEATRHETE